MGHDCLGVQLMYLLKDYATVLGERFLLHKLYALFVGDQHATFACQMTIIDAKWKIMRGKVPFYHDVSHEAFAHIFTHCYCIAHKTNGC